MYQHLKSNFTCIPFKVRVEQDKRDETGISSIYCVQQGVTSPTTNNMLIEMKHRTRHHFSLAAFVMYTETNIHYTIISGYGY
jgi:hypothetical protein